MKIDPIQQAIGRRLKSAAQAAGLSAVAIAEKMGVSDKAVYLWWQGRRQLDPQDREKYAALVGKDSWWFYRFKEEDPGARIAVLQEVMTAILQDNRPMSAVVTEVLGNHMSAADRRDLQELDGEFQADLLAGRVPMTEGLSADERRQLEEFLRNLLSKRGRSPSG